MMTSSDMSIAQREEEIQKLEQVLKNESVRIVHAGERKLSDKYTETDTALKQEKADYEQIVGRPYTPAEPKPSQVAGTLFIRPRTRTSSDESQHQEEDTALAKLS